MFLAWLDMNDVKRVGIENILRYIRRSYIHIKTCESFICEYKKGRISASIKSRSDIQHYMLEDKKGPLKPLKKRKASILF